jgi:hypothetical protein
MPADIKSPPKNSIHVIEIPLTEVSVDFHSITQSKGRPVPNDAAAAHATEVRANKAVFIDEQNHASNMNTGTIQGYLRVGLGPEFGGRLWTLLSFSPITQLNKGPLPDDAVVTRAQIKLYKRSGQPGPIRVHRAGWFDESSVNWDNRPSIDKAPIATLNTPASNGWCQCDIPVSIFNDPSVLPNACHFALLPTWSDIGRNIAFHSNESRDYFPRLVIYYQGKPPTSGTTPAPPPSTEDTTPCNITYTVMPPNPSPGQLVTITATANDDQQMYYLTIQKGSLELARQDATPGQTQLQVSHREEAQLPDMRYMIWADDAGPASPVNREVRIPVAGSGTAPTVTVTAEWLDMERVIPERYKLIKNDGQRVRIRATAEDPDGIRDLHIFINGIDYPFPEQSVQVYYDTPEEQIEYPRGRLTSVLETVTWTNDQHAGTRFYYRAQARDWEGLTTTAQGEDYQIAQPQDIRLIWHEAPPFHNFSVDEISWTRMCQIFGDGECWNVEEWGWRDAFTNLYWYALVRELAAGGCCWGISTLALELYNGRIAASALQPGITGGAWQLEKDNSYTREWIEARQGGQTGEEVVIPSYNRDRRVFSGLHPQEVLGAVERHLESDDLCLISMCEGDIWEGFAAHAVVPWMVRYMVQFGTVTGVRIYIYDCNRESGIHNPNADINNFDHYPYIEIDGDTWRYSINSTLVWSDQIEYFTYEETCGDMGHVVSSPRLGYEAPLLTDHDIPSAADVYWAWVTVGANVYFEDEEGNITGMYEGTLREEIPGSTAHITAMGGFFTDHEMYIVPRNKKLSIHVEGTDDGEYSFNLMGESTLYSITNKKIRKGVEDLFGFEPWQESLGYRFRVQPGVADDNFTVMVAAAFEGLIEALDEESIDREYIMEDVAATEESDFSIHVEEGGDTFVVESYSDDIQFDAITRSTESADYVDPNIDPGYIPSSVQEDVTVKQGRRAEITPETWASTEEKGKLHTLNKRAKGEGRGFPFIPVIIGVVIAAAIGIAATILIKKGIFKKAS